MSRNDQINPLRQTRSLQEVDPGMIPVILVVVLHEDEVIKHCTSRLFRMATRIPLSLYSACAGDTLGDPRVCSPLSLAGTGFDLRRSARSILVAGQPTTSQSLRICLQATWKIYRRSSSITRGCDIRLSPASAAPTAVRSASWNNGGGVQFQQA